MENPETDRDFFKDEKNNFYNDEIVIFKYKKDYEKCEIHHVLL